jgi:formylglycine-generating enzyme required for sulfatase activity
MKYIVLADDGNEYGPYSAIELAELLTENRLVPTSRLRREDGFLTTASLILGNWKRAAELSTVELLTCTPEPLIQPALVGQLHLMALPRDATVFLDGDEVTGWMHNITLVSDEQVVEIRIFCDGYADYATTKVIRASQVTEVAVEMIPKQTPSSGEDVSYVSKRAQNFQHLKVYIASLCSIPGGRFEMGGNKYIDEQPVHPVQLSPFRLGATPVTVAIWREYCLGTGIAMPNAPSWGWIDDHPVVNVSWNDIMRADGKGGFCAWASEVAGFRVSLPTEAQFEYAARGSRSCLEYPWGNGYDNGKLWCSVQQKRNSTAPVGRTSNIYRNPYGLTDMNGNVLQFCLDCWGSYPFFMEKTTSLAAFLGTTEKRPIGLVVDPQCSNDGNGRCVRGGSWFLNDPDVFCCAYRGRYFPDSRDYSLGFRLSAGPR